MAGDTNKVVVWSHDLFSRSRCEHQIVSVSPACCLPDYQIALLKILLAAAPTSKAKTDSINILADVLPEEMP